MTNTEPFHIVATLVKPERQRFNENGEYALRKPLPQRWWHYAEKRPALYAAISKLPRVMVVARVTKYPNVSFAPSIVYSEQLVIFADAEYQTLSLIQSSIHEIWGRQYSSTMGLGMRYTPSDVFEPFPVPSNLDPLKSIGERYHVVRADIMRSRWEGLTITYNRFHNSDETSTDIAGLRALHVEMDNTVAAAYGWQDLGLGHGFHETRQGVRYTLHPAARREVLDRLLELNHARHADEVARGLHKPKKAAKSKKAKVEDDNNPRLF